MSRCSDPRRRRAVVLVSSVVLLVLASCGSGDCGSATCDGGITFYVAELAGALARGSTEPLHICLDGACRDVTVSRDNVGGSVFVPFGGVGKPGDHTITVTGTGALRGEYTGALASYEQKPNGSGCAGSCALATVKIGAEGALTPGVPAVPATTTTLAAGSGALGTTSVSG